MLLAYLIGLLVLVAFGILLFLRWGSDWGSTAEERQAIMPGDSFLEGGPPRRVAMTRAVTINASPEIVWPWLAQLGRGAGWYSYDWLDNGRKVSARHIVSWIPAPDLGDASAIGYLRRLEQNRSLVWWVEGVRFAGATTRLVVDISLTSLEEHSRLVTRMSADATGLMARPALLIFRFIDSVMAIRQIVGIQRRVECFGARTENPEAPETGDRDQYQLYEAIYASGESAGKRGNEHAAEWRQLAIDDGVIPSEPSS
jgi:hypothetical protein